MRQATFSEIWGPQMIAFIFDLFLYGAGSVLVMQYYRSYNSSDSLPVRCAVGMVLSMKFLRKRPRRIPEPPD
ncbi:hypothetical protein PQX77_019351, partial [Marasmius sp. AFHP31]